MAGRLPDPERWRRISKILDRVLALSPQEVPAALDQACAGDPDLRSEVEGFLTADAQAGRFLETPAAAAATFLDGHPGDGGAGRSVDVEATRVGPYRLLRAIGGGGGGVVYEALDPRLERRVALKFLPAETALDPSAKERFLREARAASALDHPNIYTVHDVGESDDGRLFIVMAYYRGETLRERLARGPLPIAEVETLAAQLARGLAAAHQAGVTHRDVKPANVMLAEAGAGHPAQVKIVDFGIAKTAGDAALTRTGSSLGSPAYMSPEQARGESVDARTDVWSLGVTLYEAVAGRRPFPGSDPQAVIHAVLDQEPDPLEDVRPEVPEALARVVARCLAKDVAARYQSVPELLADLEPGAPPSATASATPRSRRPGRRPARRGRVIAAASAAGALIALALWGALKLLPEKPAIRVALMVPEVSSSEDHPDFASAAFEVVEAAVAALVALENLEPLEPPPRDERPGSRTESLRAAEADEVLRPVLDCRQDWCRVTFRRLVGSGDPVLETESFEVQVGVEHAHQLAEAVRVYLERIYPRHRRRSEPRPAVRPEDYAAFVELKRAGQRGERLGVDELERLDRLLHSSPGLIGAYLLAAGIARVVEDPERALDYADRAERLAAGDPRPVFQRFRIELESDRLDEAATTLERLEDLSPGDVRVLTSRVELMEARGDLRAAREEHEEIVARRPSWRRVLYQASLEARLGDVASARRRLEALLEEQPRNQWVLERLAALETTSGDLHRADRLFERLSGIRPALTNLGFVRFLLGDYRAAAEAYRRALEQEPASVLTRFNLATALEARGELSEARALYRTVLSDLEHGSGDPDVRMAMLKAQSLARLGRRAEAQALAAKLLERQPQDLQALHQAAQIQALLGERHAAVYYVDLCVKKGLVREWFEIPAFDALRSDPDFQKLLASSRAGAAGSQRY